MIEVVAPMFYYLTKNHLILPGVLRYNSCDPREPGGRLHLLVPRLQRRGRFGSRRQVSDQNTGHIGHSDTIWDSETCQLLSVSLQLTYPVAHTIVLNSNNIRIL